MEKYMDRVSNFRPGKRYRIVYQSQAQRYAREAVMDYLGFAGLTDELAFSARPAAGTQDMPRHWILQFEEVSKTTENYIGKRYVGKLL